MQIILLSYIFVFSIFHLTIIIWLGIDFYIIHLLPQLFLETFGRWSERGERKSSRNNTSQDWNCLSYPLRKRALRQINAYPFCDLFNDRIIDRLCKRVCQNTQKLTKP